MKSAMLTLAAVVLAMVVGCDKGSTPSGDKGKDIDVKAGPVDVNVKDGEVKVKAPNTDVEVEKK